MENYADAGAMEHAIAEHCQHANNILEVPQAEYVEKKDEVTRLDNNDIARIARALQAEVEKIFEVLRVHEAGAQRVGGARGPLAEFVAKAAEAF